MEGKKTGSETKDSTWAAPEEEKGNVKGSVFITRYQGGFRDRDAAMSYSKRGEGRPQAKAGQQLSHEKTMFRDSRHPNVGGV